MSLNRNNSNLNALQNFVSSCFCEESRCKDAAHAVQKSHKRTAKKKSREKHQARLLKRILGKFYSKKQNEVKWSKFLTMWKCALECYSVGKSAECPHNFSFVTRYGNDIR